MLHSRRTVLLSTAAVAGVAALGVPVAVLPAAAPGMQLLSGGEVVLVAALAEAFFPVGSPLGVSAADVDVPLRVDQLMAESLDPVVSDVFRYLLRAFDLGALASRGTLYAGLPLAERRAVLDTWADNAVLPRRLGYDTLKLVLGMAFFNAPEVTASVGWFPTCHLASS